jgi:RNA polymerase sigma-70 factor, ECF subfamily
VREATLRRVYADAKKAYPGISLELDAFRRHCTGIGTAAEDDEAWVQYGRELFLCAACAAGDDEAIAIFEQAVLPSAEEAIARVNASGEFLDEVLSAVRDKLLAGSNPKIRDYSARGSLVAWTKVVATRHALNHAGERDRAARRQAELAELLVQEHFDGEMLMMEGKYAELFQRALSGAVSDLPSRDRNVLRMHLLGRCSVDQIGRAYAVHRATAARWLSTTKDRLFESVQGQLRTERPGMSDEEFDSVARLVRSQLDLTFASGGTASSRVSSSSG